LNPVIMQVIDPKVAMRKGWPPLANLGARALEMV
jgi:hypothetical protein